MDQQEILSGSEQIPQFNSRDDRSPLEHAAGSSSVGLKLGDKEVLLGEGEGAISIQDMVKNWSAQLGMGVGEINGTKKMDQINKARASQKILDSYIEIFGVSVLMEIMSGKTKGGIVLSDLTPTDPRLQVYLERDGASVIVPPELDEKYKSILEFRGTENVQIDDNNTIAALTFGVKKVT